MNLSLLVFLKIICINTFPSSLIESVIARTCVVYMKYLHIEKVMKKMHTKSTGNKYFHIFNSINIEYPNLLYFSPYYYSREYMLWIYSNLNMENKLEFSIKHIVNLHIHHSLMEINFFCLFFITQFVFHWMRIFSCLQRTYEIREKCFRFWSCAE